MNIEVIYKKEDLILTPFSWKILSSDWIKSRYHTWFNLQDITEYTSHGIFPKYERHISEFMEDVQSGKKIVFAMLLKNEQQERYIHIGNVALQQIDFINRSGELAIMIGEKGYWGHHYGKFACDFMIYHAIQRVGLERVWLGTSEYNKGMQGVAESLGMTKEGVLRKAIFHDGERNDVYLYSWIKEDL